MNYSLLTRDSSAEIRNYQITNAMFTDRINLPISRFLKRILDLILSILLLLFIAPWLFTIVSLMIVIDSGGRPFFIQKRTGRNRKTFYCIKFRTMKPNAYANKLQVQPNDERITRLGKYLRQFHIDELPQVINVLLGEMSIVGPRPHMLRHNVEYAKLSPEYHLRHVAKPGLTGLAQVRGYHGMINNVNDFSNRIDSDLEYIQNWSLSLDIKIFFRTTFQILFQIG